MRVGFRHQYFFKFPFVPSSELTTTILSEKETMKELGNTIEMFQTHSLMAPDRTEQTVFSKCLPGTTVFPRK